MYSGCLRPLVFTSSCLVPRSLLHSFLRSSFNHSSQSSETDAETIEPLPTMILRDIYKCLVETYTEDEDSEDDNDITVLEYVLRYIDCCCSTLDILSPFPKRQTPIRNANATKKAP
ncbi:hypothetical protein K402DRAFT_247219 [Aulographum hederae CBS 113979]|uniref:Uncharacterized protein n=1 Tax=Aulographum hederae CBS 113979 TaxID=1176131 RepID=A0A6G1HAL3_9PEZI|nr:hypothetical protein K402DRAFT_247219 [Aulographum hederae CBS 113979]